MFLEDFRILKNWKIFQSLEKNFKLLKIFKFEKVTLREPKNLFHHTRFAYCNVEGLSPSKSYKFRVIAENIYGRSGPCDPIDLKTVSESEGKSKLGLAPDGEGVGSDGEGGRESGVVFGGDFVWFWVVVKL